MELKKNFYKKVFALVFPMALQNLINVGVQTADVVMLGNVGETTLSGASLAGQIYFILCLFIFGLTSGAAVLTAQYWGKRDIDSIEKILGISMRFCLIISTLFTIVTLCFPSALMRLFTSEPDVIAAGTEYLRIIAFSYIISCLTLTYLNILRSVECVLVSTVIYFVSLIVNVCGNSILIFGLLGAPRLGITGAALATVFARIVELLLVLLYVRLKKPPVRPLPKLLFVKDPLLFRDFIRYAAPVIINELLWGIAISTNASILGHLGKSVVAANSIVSVARQLSMVIAFGIANAAAIMVGKAIGEGREDVALVYAKRFCFLSILFGILGSFILFASLPVIQAFVNLTPTAAKYLSFMMFSMTVYCIFQSINTTLIVGIFRGGGDTKFGLIADVSTMWAFSIPVGALCAFVFHLPIYAVYLILICDELLKSPISLVHFFRKKWLHNVTR